MASTLRHSLTVSLRCQTPLIHQFCVSQCFEGVFKVDNNHVNDIQSQANANDLIALRRRELGSASPPPSQQRRVAPRLNNPSPTHLPKSMTDASSTRANRASTVSQNGPVQSDSEIEQQSRGRHASPRSPYDSSISDSALHITDGYGGRDLRRESFGGDRQRSLPDPYVGVDASMEPFDDESDIYNDSLGGREQYSFPSQLVPDVYRQDSQDPHSHNAGHTDEGNENGVMQGRPRDDWQFYHSAHHPEDSGNRCHMIGYEKRRLPRGYDDTGSDHNRLSQFDAFHRPGQALTNGEDTCKSSHTQCREIF